MQIKINLQQNYINITLAFLIFINLKKTQKNPGGLGFLKKTRIFSSPGWELSVTGIGHEWDE